MNLSTRGMLTVRLALRSCVGVQVDTISAFYTARDAMGDDEYHPIGKRGSNLTRAGGIGYMVVDVLDSLQIMGLDEEYQHARKWVAEKLSFDRDDAFSTFEVSPDPDLMLLHSFTFITLDYDTSPWWTIICISSLRGRRSVPSKSNRPRRPNDACV